jgi:hypothetical protein
MSRKEIDCGSRHLTEKNNSDHKCIEVDAGRKLTSGEESLIEEMFGNNIDFKTVRIYNRKLWSKQKDTMAIAPNGSIYFAPKVHKKDFSLASDTSKHFFIHEMTHVWQHQNGQMVVLRAISEQMLIEYPSQKLGLGHGAYKYELDQTKTLLDYGIEQQASIVADYWALKNGLHLELRNSIRATNRSEAYLTHYIIVVDEIIKK